MAAIVAALIGKFVTVKTAGNTSIFGSLKELPDNGGFEIWSNPAMSTSFGLRFGVKAIATVTAGETIVINLK